MSAITSNCIVPFNLVKRNDIGEAYANVYLEAYSNPKYLPQYVQTGSSVNFNKFSRLASIAWLTADELTFLKNGNFRIQFSINYTANYGNIQLALYINNMQFMGTYGIVSNVTFNGGKISGEFTVKLIIGDKIKLVNIASPFVISANGLSNQILANLTVTEVSY
jgi:hypothetical protein